MILSLFSNPWMFLVWVLVILTALSVHEFSHALVGTLLGDPTAKRMGRLTLNPAAHVDMFGLIALVTVGFGWGKPVPFNPYNLRDQRFGPVLIALAGPAMNLLMACLLALCFRFVFPLMGFQEHNLLIQFLILGTYLNLGLMFFNLIPIPPLDGSKLLLAALQGPGYEQWRFLLETKGPLLLLVLVAADSFLGLHVFDFLGKLIGIGMNILGVWK